MNLEFTHFSVNCLAGLLIIGFVISVFFSKKNVISWLSIGFFGGLMTTLGYFFIIYGAQERTTPILEFINFLGLCISSTCLVQVPYRISPKDRKRESVIVLCLSVVAHVYVLVYVWLFMESEAIMTFESHMLAFRVRHVERSNVVFIVEYFLTLLLLLRNTLDQDSEPECDVPSGFAKRWGKSIRSGIRKLVLPQNDQGIVCLHGHYTYFLVTV